MKDPAEVKAGSNSPAASVIVSRPDDEDDAAAAMMVVVGVSLRSVEEMNAWGVLQSLCYSCSGCVAGACRCCGGVRGWVVKRTCAGMSKNNCGSINTPMLLTRAGGLVSNSPHVRPELTYVLIQEKTRRNCWWCVD